MNHDLNLTPYEIGFLLSVLEDAALKDNRDSQTAYKIYNKVKLLADSIYDR